MNENSYKRRLEEVAYIINGKVLNKLTGKQISAVIPVHVFGHIGDIESY